MAQHTTRHDFMLLPRRPASAVSARGGGARRGQHIVGPAELVPHQSARPLHRLLQPGWVGAAAAWRVQLTVCRPVPQRASRCVRPGCASLAAGEGLAIECCVDKLGEGCRQPLTWHVPTPGEVCLRWPACTGALDCVLTKHELVLRCLLTGSICTGAGGGAAAGACAAPAQPYRGRRWRGGCKQGAAQRPADAGVVNRPLLPLLASHDPLRPSCSLLAF